jgi:mannose-6-phosphate isomerase-like protein (cupin superfamily)
MAHGGKRRHVADGKFHTVTGQSPDLRHSSASNLAPLHPKVRGKHKVSTANPSFGRFHLHQIAQAFPETAETLLLDTYLTDEPAASSRVFRVYRATPPHYHAHSDEHLYVLSGRGTFWMESSANSGEFAPGDFLFFKNNTVHAIPDLLEDPVVFLAIDTPRRDPKDIIFVDPKDGTLDTFIRNREP